MVSIWKNLLSRLIGAPPGYIGYESGQLSEKVGEDLIL